jgi:hypothetical protein
VCAWLILATNCNLCSLLAASCLLLFWISSNSRTFSTAIYSLIGERRDHLDLLSVNGRVTERASTSTDRAPFAQQRNRERGAQASSFLGLTPCVFRISQNIGDLDSPAFQQGPVTRPPDSLD